MPSKRSRARRSTAKLPAPREQRPQPAPIRQDGEVALTSRSIQAYSGPLPAPHAFAHYDETLPGAANRILTMAENEQQIRADGQSKVLSNDRWRITGATLLGLAVTTVAGIAAWKGNWSIALPLGLAGLFATISRQVFAWLRARKTDGGTHD